MENRFTVIFLIYLVISLPLYLTEVQGEGPCRTHCAVDGQATFYNPEGLCTLTSPDGKCTGGQGGGSCTVKDNCGARGCVCGAPKEGAEIACICNSAENSGIDICGDGIDNNQDGSIDEGCEPSPCGLPDTDLLKLQLDAVLNNPYNYLDPDESWWHNFGMGFYDEFERYHGLDVLSGAAGISPAGFGFDVETLRSGVDPFTGEQVPTWLAMLYLIPLVGEAGKVGGKGIAPVMKLMQESDNALWNMIGLATDVGKIEEAGVFAYLTGKIKISYVDTLVSENTGEYIAGNWNSLTGMINIAKGTDKFLFSEAQIYNNIIHELTHAFGGSELVAWLKSYEAMFLKYGEDYLKDLPFLKSLKELIDFLLGQGYTPIQIVKGCTKGSGVPLISDIGYGVSKYFPKSGKEFRKILDTFGSFTERSYENWVKEITGSV